MKSFADSRTQDLYFTGSCRDFPNDIVRRAIRKLEYVNLATTLQDLLAPRGNRLHRLVGDREGMYPIAISDQWRVCFRFEDGDAWDVEVCDYH
ncbi:MAG TPA: type II toxin-antitoxin system RelE/ParE family toxin [Bacteroidota bacterium]|nr:type II toxin-antitoxin system RelE/ParE family toxin [Bacteroidota bacterium]